MRMWGLVRRGLRWGWRRGILDGVESKTIGIELERSFVVQLAN